MKTLVLLRHGKSSWDNPDLPDHDRPLAQRGLRAARQIGRHLREQGFVPDLILCSSARRTTATLALVMEELGGADIPTERERGLYLQGRAVLLERLRDLPEAIGTTLLVGHNPDLHELANLLIGAGEPLALAAVREKFPTAACATLQFGTVRWRDIAPGSARLVSFVVPDKTDDKKAGGKKKARRKKDEKGEKA